MKSLIFLYRRLAVLSCLALFFPASLLFNFICALGCLFGLRKRMAVLSRRTLSALLRFWFNYNRWLHILFIQAPGLDEIRQRRGCICVANHPTIIDALILLAYVPNCVCVYKRTLGASPFYGFVAEACGFIPNVGGPDMVRMACQRLEEGCNLIIFPEGTRTREIDPSSWKRGFALIAQRSRAPMALLWIASKDGFLRKGVPLAANYRAIPAEMKFDHLETIQVTEREPVENILSRIATRYLDRQTASV